MADGRLAIVIASQCQAAIDERDSADLDFVPPLGWTPDTPLRRRRRLAFELYEQLVDPAAGACAAVPGLAALDGVTLAAPDQAVVINPTLAVAEQVLDHSFAQAHDDDAGLVVHFLGHGNYTGAEHAVSDHFLQVVDSASYPATDREGWNIYGQARQLLANRALSAFMLLVDACYAAMAGPTVHRWANAPRRVPYLWLGASQDRPAFDGCFTRAITDVLRSGVSEAAHPDGDFKQRLDDRDLARIVDGVCGERVDGETGRPKRQKTDGFSNPSSEPALYVALNRAADELSRQLGLRGGTADRLLGARRNYQPNHPDVARTAFDGRNFAVVTGGAGSGKTVLAAVLRHPPRGVPIVRADAVAFLERRTTPHLLAEALHPQLATNLAYRDAIEIHRSHDPEEFDRQTAFGRYLDGPLAYFNGRVTIVADGLDQLDPDVARDETIAALTHLTTVHPDKVQVLATSRPEGPIPDGAHQIPIPVLTETVARGYLVTRGVDDPDLQDRILRLGDTPNWLVLKLAADQALADPDRLTADVGEMYQTIVTDAKADPDIAAADVDRVVAVLAAAGQVAGVGPRLPYPLFEHAVGRLGGDPTRAALYPILSQRSLYRIVERSHPATANEHLGLFHLTTIDTLSQSSPIPTADAHTAIVAAIDALDPPTDRP